ncbi:unnamed protein product [Prorocentrum cordatum]|uniref:FYVE-type domain-containing protein n=1 Tax=Prorocentrum cordatum TaxID=2364126 RepID=A0ABN9TTW3_9DINO|nr:unnamed protein product [Polarella glacialis]
MPQGRRREEEGPRMAVPGCTAPRCARGACETLPCAMGPARALAAALAWALLPRGGAFRARGVELPELRQEAGRARGPASRAAPAGQEEAPAELQAGERPEARQEVGRPTGPASPVPRRAVRGETPPARQAGGHSEAEREAGSPRLPASRPASPARQPAGHEGARTSRKPVGPSALSALGSGRLGGAAAARSGALTRQALQGVDHLQEQALGAAVVVYALVVVCCAAYTIAGKDDHRTQELKRLQSFERDRLNEAVHTLADQMEASLAEMAEDATLLAESNFEDKRRDFLKFLRSMKEQPQKLGHAGLAASLRRFVRQWLEAFKECSLDPGSAPVVVLQDEELGRTESMPVAEMLGLLVEKLDKVEVRFAVKAVVELRAARNARTDPGSAAARSVLPPVRCICAATCAVLLGVALAALNWARDLELYAVCALIAALASPLIAMRADTSLERLNLQVAQLKEQKADVEARHTEVARVFGKLQSVTHLWLHRVLPRLELLTEVHAALAHASASEAAGLLNAGCDMLDQVTKALGPLPLWWGDTMLSEKHLAVLTAQLTDSSQGVSTRVDAGATLLDKSIARSIARKNDGWAAKKSAADCCGCKQSFYVGGVLICRRNHCRRCGGLFCTQCTTQEMCVPKLGYAIPVKVCDKCALELVKEENVQKQMAQASRALGSGARVLRVVTPLEFLSVRKICLLGMMSKEAQPLGVAELRFRDLPVNTWTTVRKPLDGVTQGDVEMEVRFSEDALHLT